MPALKTAAAFREAVEMAGRIRPRGSPDGVGAQLGLADVLILDGDPAAAERLCRAGLESLDRLAGDTGCDRVFALGARPVPAPAPPGAPLRAAGS